MKNRTEVRFLQINGREVRTEEHPNGVLESHEKVSGSNPYTYISAAEIKAELKRVKAEEAEERRRYE